jgi:hypothetical protein
VSFALGARDFLEERFSRNPDDERPILHLEARKVGE